MINQNELFTSADGSCILSSRPPGGVVVEVSTPLTILSSCVVQTHTLPMNLRNRHALVPFRQN